MSAIEEVLWNTFTSYTLNGNPKDPSRLNGSGLLKFCRDIMVLDPIMTETPLTKAGLDIIYTSEIKSPKKMRGSQVEREKSDKLDFDQFLSALIKIAIKCYPTAKSKDEAMQQLLMDNILPMAHKRKPINISSFLKQPAVEALFKYYENALTDMFKFYSASSDQTQKGKNMIKATSNIVKTFDDQIGLIEESKAKSQHHNTFSHCVGYTDFMRFCNDFSMTTSLGVTSLDIGDIYLSVLASNSFSPTLRKIEFKEFWEAIVRCALVAFQDSVKTTTENKVKALFHYIWRNTQSRTQDHMICYGTLGGGGFNTYRGGLLKGTQLMNERFVLAWTKDEYRDYLDVEGHSVLASTAEKHHKKALETAAIAATASVDNLKHKSSSSSNSSRTPNPPSGPPPSHSSQTTSTPSTTSFMQKLLSGKSASSQEEVKSPVRGREEKPSSSTSNIWVSEGDKDHSSQDGNLMDLLHDNIERRENFTVKTNDGNTVCVMIRDEDHVSDADGRINVQDLRRLLSVRPDIAVILYDCIVEEGIMDPYEFESPSQSDEESGFASPAARSRTNSKVAFTPDVDSHSYNDDDDEEGDDLNERSNGHENEDNAGEISENGADDSNTNDLSMRELDDLVDSLVEETGDVTIDDE